MDVRSLGPLVYGQQDHRTQDLRAANLEAREMKCCPNYCGACRRHHGGADCPPLPDRMTKLELAELRIEHLEELLWNERNNFDDLKKRLDSLAVSR